MQKRNARQIRRFPNSEFSVNKPIEEQIKFLLRYAVLAPSTHNVQPWLFRVRNNICEIHLNKNLHLPYADPLKRDAYISLGCCLTNLVVAAKCFHMYESHVYNSVEENEKVAEVTFKSPEIYKIDDVEILEAIKNRINSRGPFLKEILDVQAVDKLKKIANASKLVEFIFIDDKNMIFEIANLTAEGMKIAHSNTGFRAEMSRWINHNLSNRLEGMPGYSMHVPTMISFFIAPFIKLFNLGVLLGKLNYLGVSSAPVICIALAKNNQPDVWLDTGFYSELTMLRAYMENINSAIYLAAIEIEDMSQKLKNILKTDKIPQFLFCLGKIKTKTHTTPRHSYNFKLIDLLFNNNL